MTTSSAGPGARVTGASAIASYALFSGSRAHTGQRVVVVTHAGVISQMLGSQAGARPAQWQLFRPAPASVTVVCWRGRAGTLLHFDQLYRRLGVDGLV